MNVDDCRIIDLPKIKDIRGNLTFIEEKNHIPFEIQRVFYIYDIPGGVDRGAHSHKECHQFLIAVSGSFSVEMDDGKNKKTINLNTPYFGLHIPPGIWSCEVGFSSGAVCLVLASTKYDENDYIRDYNEFISSKL